MELGGMNLLDIQKQNAVIPLQTIGNYCIQMAKSISFLHQMQFIHRDIKPENYIIAGQFVKLIDFGLIKRSNLFLKTQNVGTPGFQAPEIVEGSNNYTQKVDIWALGCTFYELIKKEQLINSNDLGSLNNVNNQNGVYAKINQLQISDTWKKILQQMLNPKPEFRQSIFEILKSIENQSIVGQTQSFPALSFPTQSGLSQQHNNLPQFQNIFQQMNNLIQALQNPNSMIQLKQNLQSKQSIEKLIETLKEVLGKIFPNANQVQGHNQEAQLMSQNIMEKIHYVEKLLEEIQNDKDYQNSKQNLMASFLDIYSKKQALLQNIEDYNQKIAQFDDLQMSEQQLKQELQEKMQQENNNLQLQEQRVFERIQQQNQQVGEMINLSHEQILKVQQDKIVELQFQLRVAQGIEQLFKKNQEEIEQLQQYIDHIQITKEQLYEQTLNLQKLKIQKQLLIEQSEKFNAQNEEIKEHENKICELKLNAEQIDKQVLKNQLKAKVQYLEQEIEKQRNLNVEIDSQKDQLLSQLEIYKKQIEEFEKIKKEKEIVEKKLEAEAIKIQQIAQYNAGILKQNKQNEHQPEKVENIQLPKEIDDTNQQITQQQFLFQQQQLEQQRVLQTDPQLQNQFQKNFKPAIGNNQNNQRIQFNQFKPPQDFKPPLEFKPLQEFKPPQNFNNQFNKKW